uniref:Uncharacterized protein n=1 Tax=Tanacetum cinerariifolium TaxID=118510 RepID=A0A699L3J9_TANCI|nr:hypothetical protein [Tanacetum cinerariifolium]
MKGYFDILESLSMVFDAELSINTIISGLPVDYNQFMLSSVGHNAKKRNTFHSSLKKRPQKESPIVGLRERLNMRLHLQAIQRKQCASTTTQRGIGSVAAKNIERTSKTKRSKRVVTHGLNESRRLHHGELNLDMRKKKIMPVTRIGKY